MNTRPIREEDIEQVINLFQLNYGDNYPIPEFYDPMWVKRGIYSDHIIWMVIEDDGRIVASGAAILDFGDYNDQIAEIGRLVVDPASGGKGLGRTLLNALVDASDDRVEFAFGEARTTHIKTQRIFDRVGLVPLGFLPMTYRVNWRESWVLSGQLFGNGRRLRQPETIQLIPQAAPIASLALSNLELEDQLSVRSDARSYPLERELDLEPLSGPALVRLLKIEQGRLLEPEVFGGLHVDQGITHLKARNATYLVANEGNETLGAVGYVHDEANQSVRIIELIARDDSVKGGLLRRAVEEAEQVHAAEIIDCDVSAHHASIQRTLFELGFVPAAYVPGMVFHHTSRWDVVKMIKLNISWDLGSFELTETSQAMYDVVAPLFLQRDEHCKRKQLAHAASVLKGMSPLEIELVQRAGEVITSQAGSQLETDSLYIVLDGAIQAENKIFKPGETYGINTLLAHQPGKPAWTNEETHLLRLSHKDFDTLCNRHPRLGIKLIRNISAEGWS